MFALWLFTLLWAVTATAMLLRNPLPIPDRGHRLFGVPDEKAHGALLEIVSRAGLPLRFRFSTGPTVQSLLWDNETVIHLVDSFTTTAKGLNGNGISLPVADPKKSASVAIRILRAAGFSAELVTGFDEYLPENHLAMIKSSACLDWVLVFRRHVLRMPKPQFRKNS